MPDDASPPLSSIEIANIGVIPLLERVTALRDWFEKSLHGIIG